MKTIDLIFLASVFGTGFVLLITFGLMLISPKGMVLVYEDNLYVWIIEVLDFLFIVIYSLWYLFKPILEIRI